MLYIYLLENIFLQLEKYNIEKTLEIVSII